MLIYKIENLVNGKVYIGQTVKTFKRRIGQHLSGLRLSKHTNDHLQKAFNKYGESSFSFELIVETKHIHNLDDLERFWIDFYNSTDHQFGYNNESGGNVNKTFVSPFKGIPMSEKRKQALRDAKKGKSYSHIAYQNAPKVPCVCENTITGEVTTYPTLLECSFALGVEKSVVGHHVKRSGKLINKTWRVRRLKDI